MDVGLLRGSGRFFQSLFSDLPCCIVFQEGSYDDSEYDNYGADGDGYSLDDARIVDPSSALSDHELAYELPKTPYNPDLDQNLSADLNGYITGPSLRVSTSAFAPSTPLDPMASLNGSRDALNPEENGAAKRRKISESEKVSSVDGALQQPFDDEEDAKILQYLDLHGENWKLISSLLGTNRCEISPLGRAVRCFLC